MEREKEVAMDGEKELKRIDAVRHIITIMYTPLTLFL